MRVGSVALVGAVSVWTFLGAASAKHKEQVLPPFEATTQCMIGVLQTEPHVKNARVEGSGWHERLPPYVVYEVVDEKGDEVTIRFQNMNEHGPIWFQVMLAGLVGAGEKLPRDYGTQHVIHRWHGECHVAAGTLHN